MSSQNVVTCDNGSPDTIAGQRLKCLIFRRSGVARVPNDKDRQGVAARHVDAVDGSLNRSSPECWRERHRATAVEVLSPHDAGALPSTAKDAGPAPHIDAADTHAGLPHPVVGLDLAWAERAGRHDQRRAPHPDQLARSVSTPAVLPTHRCRKDTPLRPHAARSPSFSPSRNHRG